MYEKQLQGPARIPRLFTIRSNFDGFGSDPTSEDDVARFDCIGMFSYARVGFTWF